MKKLILLLLTFLLCGCSHDMNRREIDEINFIHVIGIDYENEVFTLSALYSSGAGADPESGGAAEEISTGVGDTPYEALEDLIAKNKKSITLAQTGFFLIGDEAAENGIDICLDFLSRDETIKMESLIYITKDEKASDFINKGIENEQMVHEDLEAIKQKQQEVVTRNDNNLVNILNEMNQNYSSLLVPYVISEEKGFLIEGYAVFDQLKLKDYLDNETSSGVNFIKNIIRTYPIYLKDKAGLSISYSETDLQSELEGNNIKITIKIDFETMIREVHDDKTTFTRDGLKKLTEEQNQYMIKLIEKPVNYSIATGLDILQLARLVENQNVKKWKNLEAEWTQSISDIKYEYEVNSKIVKSFILGNER
jgi:spore germination protein KC